MIEMLVVIAIIGILAAVSLPTISQWGKGNVMLASTRQMLDDVARARQYAISQRTTVYMVFCPTNFWSDANYAPVLLNTTEKAKGEKLYGKQLNAYTFVTLRSVGEQPGGSSPRYLASWKTLPEGATIALWKFNSLLALPTVITDAVNLVRSDFPLNVYGFNITTNIPFPSVDAPPKIIANVRAWAALPYIAFNHLGQTESGKDEFIPLAQGSVSYSFDPVTKVPTQFVPTVTENPPNNSINAFTIVHINALTGRAKLEKQEFR